MAAIAYLSNASAKCSHSGRGCKCARMFYKFFSQNLVHISSEKKNSSGPIFSLVAVIRVSTMWC